MSQEVKCFAKQQNGWLRIQTLYGFSFHQRSPEPLLHAGNVIMSTSNLEPKTKTSGWDLINYPANSPTCNMALRLGSHWSHDPVYVTALSWAVRRFSMNTSNGHHVKNAPAKQGNWKIPGWRATRNVFPTFATLKAEKIPYKANVGAFVFSLLN